MGQASSFFYGSTAEEHVLQGTKLGTVEGKKYTLEDGRCVNAFLGVPYARCTAERRFKKAEPVLPWDGVLKCTDFGPRPIQQDMIWDRFITPVRQDEDCLSLNIFTPTWAIGDGQERQLPVMVFVHGGGWAMHSAANYGDRGICRNLCTRDVVVCVIQYRLGLLGFLSTGTEECPGNMGLWDQLEAFRWIKSNISSFGGDPSNVTAFGQSAGAASIDLLSISPRGAGLISRVIMMGGTASSDWAIVEPSRTVQAAEQIARKLGWKGNAGDTQDLLDFLREQPAHKLSSPMFGKSAFDRRKKGLDFCPVIDGDLLPKPVSELRRQAPKVSAIIGTTDYEALLFVALGRAQADEVSINKALAVHIPDDVPNYENLRTEARQMYLHDVDTSNKEQVARSFVRLYSDTLMNNCTHKYCEEMAASGHEVFLYNMTYYNKDAFGIFSYRMPFLAATHCYELRFLFGKGLFSKFRPNSDDLCILDLMTKMWTNFARTGKPLVDENNNIWQPVSVEDSYRHLVIDLEPRMCHNYQGRRAEFWKKVDELRHSSG
ncbi:Protein F15A8.6 [Aphelenchoides avenae]|nr:Protein F15A8.6 [Aphelenchus avenae]